MVGQIHHQKQWCHFQRSYCCLANRNHIHQCWPLHRLLWLNVCNIYTKQDQKDRTSTSLSKREDWIRYLNQNLKKNMIYYRIDIFLSNMEECGKINICDIMSSGCYYSMSMTHFNVSIHYTQYSTTLVYSQNISVKHLFKSCSTWHNRFLNMIFYDVDDVQIISHNAHFNAINT